MGFRAMPIAPRGRSYGVRGASGRPPNIRNPAARHTRVLHMWPQPATIAGWGSGDAGIWGTRGKHIMAVTRTALKTEQHPHRAGVTLATFVWQGTDKRGVKMLGEQQSNSAHLLRAELRSPGLMPTAVQAKPTPPFGAPANRRD